MMKIASAQQRYEDAAIFRDQLNVANLGVSGKVIGGWDIHNKCYTISIQPTNNSPEKLQPTGWLKYFSFSLDHKVIGLQYLVCGFIFYLIAYLFLSNGLITLISDGNSNKEDSKATI